jgi:flagellar biosynthesis/type III secretory pathway protein FliH
MLNLDLNKSVAVRQVRQMAREKGRAEGLAKGLAEGRTEGRTEGRAEGRAEGRTEGRTEGRAEGRAEGHLEEARQLILEALQERFRRVPKGISLEIHRLQQHDVLKTLFRQALRCPNLSSFKEVLMQVK